MSHSVGCRSITAFDSVQNAALSAWLLYPTDAVPQLEHFGSYSLPLAHDAAAARGNLPLVALSHGNGSTPWVHRGLAADLARAGFAVLMIEHPGNNRKDNSLGFSGAQGRVKSVLLTHRPRHVQLAVDGALADPLVGGALGTAGYAVIGESIGGYTALALAGGRAMTLPDDLDAALLAGPANELAKHVIPVATQPDPRVRAVVLFSPAIGFFMADDALANVDVPVMVRAGSEDRLCPWAQISFCLRSLPPDRLQGFEVSGAGHFSFQTPYPRELAHLPSAQDPAGFDREAYQLTLKQDVGGFLQAALAPR
ncbi:MAG TPA: alpha/beta hydrolase [Polyangiales bacterium]|nr:alpha/beta hydrolase [Polyangiales bacterium]